MIDTDIADLFAAGGLLLFTGGDIAATDSMVEIISKFGVVAVLWYWLRDMKSQMSILLKTFDKETNEIRTHYDKVIIELKDEHKDYKDRIDKQIEQKNKENESLHNKLYDVIENKEN